MLLDPEVHLSVRFVIFIKQVMYSIVQKNP